MDDDYIFTNVTWADVESAAQVIKNGIQYLNLSQALKNRIDQYIGRFGGGFAVCDTAAGTAAKTAALQDGGTYALCRGGLVLVYFANAVPENATLNINSTGAKQIWFQGSRIGDGVIGAGTYALLSYVFVNGGSTGAYELITTDHLADKKLAEFGCCRHVVAGSGTSFTASVANYRLVHGGYQALYFENDVGANATLNISDTGNLPIWFCGEPIKSGTILAGDRVMCVYVSGANERYDLLSVDRANWVRKTESYGIGHGYASLIPGLTNGFQCVLINNTISGFVPTYGSPFTLEFQSAAPGGSTLNVLDTGAYPLYFRGSAITDGVIPAGSKVLLVKLGNYYHVLSVDKGAILSGMQAARTSSMMAKVGYDSRSGRLFAENGLSDEAKTELLNVIAYQTFPDKNGRTYYNALEDALYPPGALVSISAAFNQGSTVIYEDTPLDELRPMLTVTALYDDASWAEVTAYQLYGTLAAGTSTVTVVYREKQTSFNVTVTENLRDGYIIVGNPTISENILTPANGGYIRCKREFDPSDPWMIQFSVKTTNGSTGQNIFMTADANGDRVRSLQCQFFYSSQYGLSVYFYASSNGTNWDLFSSIGVNNQSANRYLLLQLKYTGTKYQVRTSSDDGATWYGWYDINASGNIIGGGYLSFCPAQGTTPALIGSCDLTKLKVWINDELWWDAVPDGGA